MAEIWRNLDWSVLTDMLISVIPALLCITLHELCHGLTAYKLGDSTAKDAGRLTLNPIKHLDIAGLVMMVVFKFGWAKPVPVDMRNFRHPKRDMAITALAGPVSNFLLAAAVLFIYGAVYPFLYKYGPGQTVLSMLYTTAYLSIALGIFNFIPIPPLDGSKVLFSALSDSAYYKLMRYERYGMLFLIVLIIVVNRLGNPLGTAAGFVMDGFFKIAELSFSAVSHFIR